MSLVNLSTPPDKTKPCWVLSYEGRRFGTIRLCLQEFMWHGESWRPTTTPVEHPRSLYKALAKADWMGKIPQQGRKRRVYTRENLERVRELQAQGVTNPAEIAKQTGISRRVAAKLCNYEG